MENIIQGIDYCVDRRLPQDEERFLQQDLACPTGRGVLWESRDNVADREQGKRFINKRITEAREELLHQEKDETANKRTYAIDFDTVAYRTLKVHTGLPGFYEAKEDLDRYTAFQMRTLLGERFHTGLSRYSSSIIDGLIYPDDMAEPFIDVLKRGRDFRKVNGSTETKREDAEVSGFTEIQKVLCDQDTPAGTKMLSISPAGSHGSIYKKNFYDVFTKEINAEGKPIVKVHRYSSALSIDETVLKLCQINAGYGENGTVDDSYLLAHPIQISAQDKKLPTADAVHQFLHKEHNAMSERDFADIIEICTPAILGYIDILSSTPEDEMMQKLAFNAILNMADYASDRKKNLKGAQSHDKKTYSHKDTLPFVNKPMGRADIFIFGTTPVRQVDTGCGSSGGYEVTKGMTTGFGNSPLLVVNGIPYSVISFGMEKTLDCTCPMCGEEVEATIAHGKITCPSCNSSASYEC